jgi:uncharacterized protein (UPF0548 family)
MPAPPDAAPDGWACDRDEIVLATGPERAVVAERARQLVLAYRIFPPTILTPALPAMTVRPSDTIVQGITLGPLGLIAAIRVTTVFDRERDGIRRTGFSYVTLGGHPERGALTSAVVDNSHTATVTFEIDSISRPGHWLIRLGRPIARRVQRASIQAALARVAALAREGEGSSGQGAGMTKG